MTTKNARYFGTDVTPRPPLPDRLKDAALTLLSDLSGSQQRDLTLHFDCIGAQVQQGAQAIGILIDNDTWTVHHQHQCTLTGLSKGYHLLRAFLLHKSEEANWYECIKSPYAYVEAEFFVDDSNYSTGSERRNGFLFGQPSICVICPRSTRHISRDGRILVDFFVSNCEVADPGDDLTPHGFKVIIRSGGKEVGQVMEWNAVEVPVSAIGSAGEGLSVILVSPDGTELLMPSYNSEPMLADKTPKNSSSQAGATSTAGAGAPPVAPTGGGMPFEDPQFRSLYQLSTEGKQGANGIAFSATSKKTGEPVELQFVPIAGVPGTGKMGANNMGARTEGKVRNEVAAMRQIGKHVHIPCFIADVRSDDGKWWCLIKERVDAAPLLEEMLKRIDCGDEITEQMVAGWLHGPVKAIAGMHEKDLGHCSITPDSFHLAGNKGFLLGFGDSRVQAAGHTKVEGEPGGDPPDWAPELVEGEPSNVSKVDSWALGCAIYSLLCGRHPFDNPRGQMDTDDGAEAVEALIAKGEFGGKDGGGESVFGQLSTEARELVGGLLVPSAQNRTAVAVAADHPWFRRAKLGHSELPQGYQQRTRVLHQAMGAMKRAAGR
jgi:hypothetical protein